MTEKEINQLDARSWSELCTGYAAWWRTWKRAGNPQRAKDSLELAVLARDRRNEARRKL